MARLSKKDCQQRWNEALRARGWAESKLGLIMFDYCPIKHGPTHYAPAPAWPTIADDNHTADEADYGRIEASLLAQGERYSGFRPPIPDANPVSVDRVEVVATITTVMATVDPWVVSQEQILRAAFFAQLPAELRKTIGTARAAVHPELPTPNPNYVITGKRRMHARYDLGFGHPSKPTGIVELKAGLSTFDRLETISRFVEKAQLSTLEQLESCLDEESDAEENASLPIGQTEKLEEPLILDLLKLLDPDLPPGSFRISWIANGKGRSSAADIRIWAQRIINRAAKERELSGASFDVDAATGWLVCTWPQPPVRLELAWYRPEGAYPGKFEPVFGKAGG
jgi:hypothetical protein